ncbi:hypothetical protein PIB30_019737 [Stylosanthes scabra]|uniref:Uncharacterized protein n=1 Tax=Stylosanthes scabra TaxID=79078 RepID=A0ABU6W9B3_9FABA|nr:hypothetical protein [Stylosanthes scabra]
MRCPKWKGFLHHGQSRTATEATGMHTAKDCRDLLEFVEKRLMKGKFCEYNGRSSDRRDDRRTRQRVDSPEKSAEGKDEPRDGVVRIEIKMISGGLPDEGNLIHSDLGKCTESYK